MRFGLFRISPALLLSTIVILSAGNVRAQSPYAYSIQKQVKVSHGAVVSAHPLASMAGTAILQQGGNAVDAAITTQLALAVVYPGAGNIGGGGFMVAHLTKGHGFTKDQDIAIDFREKAPAAATRDMYLDAAGNPRPGLSEDGHLAAGVPGSIAGIFSAMKYARLPFPKLIQPAIDLAENGFVITEAEAEDLNETAASFTKLNTVRPVFVRDRPWHKGDTLVQKDLAKTLRLIRDQGAKGFYEGETASLIVAEMQRGKGIITLEDLRNYRAVERQAVTFPYKGYSVVTMPLPSSGGVVLQQMLKMVENQPLASYGYGSPKAVQLMAEVERLAYADRAKWLGDVDFVKVPVKTLTSQKYLQERMKHFTPGKAGVSKDIAAGYISPASEETTHFDVYDQDGNAVSITTTLNGGYGSRVVVGGAGFLLNNEMDDFSIKPSVPNMYGAVGAEANAIVPGKRMLSSMTPAIVLDKGKVYIVAGTPGGTTITTSVFQTLVDIIDFKMDANDAVNRPKFHHQWLPDELFVERSFSPTTLDSLRNMGYHISQRGAIGRTEVIRILPDKTIEAVGDHRGDDTAIGY